MPLLMATNFNQHLFRQSYPDIVCTTVSLFMFFFMYVCGILIKITYLLTYLLIMYLVCGCSCHGGPVAVIYFGQLNKLLM